MTEIHGFAILEKSTNVRLRTIRKEDMEIFEGKKKWMDLRGMISLALLKPRN